MFSNIQELRKTLKALTKKLSAAMNSNKSMSQRADNMQTGLISLEHRYKQLQQKIYATRQEMLRDIVTAADVVSTRFNLIDSWLIKKDFCRYAPRVLLLHAQLSM